MLQLATWLILYNTQLILYVRIKTGNVSFCNTFSSMKNLSGQCGMRV